MWKKRTFRTPAGVNEKRFFGFTVINLEESFFKQHFPKNIIIISPTFIFAKIKKACNCNSSTENAILSFVRVIYYGKCNYYVLINFIIHCVKGELIQNYFRICFSLIWDKNLGSNTSRPEAKLKRNLPTPLRE